MTQVMSHTLQLICAMSAEITGSCVRQLKLVYFILQYHIIFYVIYILGLYRIYYKIIPVLNHSNNMITIVVLLLLRELDCTEN